MRIRIIDKRKNYLQSGCSDNAKASAQMNHVRIGDCSIMRHTHSTLLWSKHAKGSKKTKAKYSTTKRQKKEKKGRVERREKNWRDNKKFFLYVCFCVVVCSSKYWMSLAYSLVCVREYAWWWWWRVPPAGFDNSNCMGVAALVTCKNCPFSFPLLCCTILYYGTNLSFLPHAKVYRKRSKTFGKGMSWLKPVKIRRERWKIYAHINLIHA